MEDWQSWAAVVVVLATGVAFLTRLFRGKRGCGDCNGGCQTVRPAEKNRKG
jgi:hypothetical protein